MHVTGACSHGDSGVSVPAVGPGPTRKQYPAAVPLDSRIHHSRLLSTRQRYFPVAVVRAAAGRIYSAENVFVDERGALAGFCEREVPSVSHS